MAEQLSEPYAPFLDGLEEDPLEALSAFVNADLRWVVNNSSMQDYSRRAHIDGRIDGLTDIITERIGTSEDNVGLDLAAGSKAQAVRDLMYSGVLGRALVTNYRNRLPWKIRRDPRLDHIKGNLIRKGTWAKIIDWQTEHVPEGFNLVMHRPVGALQYLHPPEDIYGGAAHLLLDMVQEGGVMFTQVPRALTQFRKTELEKLCEGVRERPDVEDVLTTTGRRPQRLRPPHQDESDMYAVILKR